MRFGVKSNHNIDFKSLFKDKTPEQIREFIKKYVFVSPNQVAFVRKSIRHGIIPQVLDEFLNTRIMIKKSFQMHGKVIKKLLNQRQAVLKLFMNVLYGYTGASFTGRMPCSDIADSVVETGRSLLTTAMNYINENKAWRAKVEYGDTDSLFVHLKGRTVADAFRIGMEMQQECTKLFPYPVELKFEKVYCPTILVSKKRYVGYKYEQPGQQPVFEGKGLELVRRDGCDAIVKIMSKCIYELFETRNLSNVKRYLEKQWSKILNGHVNIKDFCIAKEVKLNKYSEKTIPAHGIVAQKMGAADIMELPKYAERIKYLVVQGSQKAKVRDLVMSIPEFMSSMDNRINSIYYITR